MQLQAGQRAWHSGWRGELGGRWCAPATYPPMQRCCRCLQRGGYARSCKAWGLQPAAAASRQQQRQQQQQQRQQGQAQQAYCRLRMCDVTIASGHRVSIVHTLLACAVYARSFTYLSPSSLPPGGHHQQPWLLPLPPQQQQQEMQQQLHQHHFFLTSCSRALCLLRSSFCITLCTYQAVCSPHTERDWLALLQREQREMETGDAQHGCRSRRMHLHSYCTACLSCKDRQHPVVKQMLSMAG